MRNSAISKQDSLLSSIPPEVPVWSVWKRDPIGRVLRLCAVGDIGFSGHVGYEAERSGFRERFSEVAPFLKQADIVFGNLETPFLRQRSATKMFAADPESARGLFEAGFSILHLANNHIYDFGAEGLQTTMDSCAAVGLKILGAGNDRERARQMVRTDADGIRIGWLGCGRTLKAQADDGPGYWEFNEAEVLDAIQVNRPHVDVLILSVHIGLMYMDYPDPLHKQFAESAIHKGADMVLMHHAHVLQGVKVYDGKAACFNLGNFLLDCAEGYVQGTSALKEQREGAVFSFELDSRGICGLDIIPTMIAENFCVNWARGTRGEQVIERLRNISLPLDGDYSHLFSSQRADRTVSHSLKVLLFHIKERNWKIVGEILGSLRLSHIPLVLRWFSSKLFRGGSGDVQPGRDL